MRSSICYAVIPVFVLTWLGSAHAASFAAARWCLLWSPYGIGQTIIFSSCGFFFFLMAALCNRGAIIFLPFNFYLLLLSIYLLFFPRLISAAAGWRCCGGFAISAPWYKWLYLLTYLLGCLTWCGPSAYLECRSERCCMRLTANAGPKKVAKNRHLGTIPQLCRAIPSQVRQQSVPPIFGRAAITLGIGPHF